MIVVTGGAGFIGSNLVAGLEARGAGEIVVVDWLGTEDKWQNLAKRELRAVVPPEELAAFLDAPANRERIDTHEDAPPPYRRRKNECSRRECPDEPWKATPSRWRRPRR